MRAYKQQLGKLGETYARAFLEAQGYGIKEMNYRCRYGEVDIIAYKESTWVLVEVKTRTTVSFGAPQDSIDDNKAEQIYNTALYYLQKKYEWETFSWRVDAVEVFLGKTKYKIRHTKNIV